MGFSWTWFIPVIIILVIGIVMGAFTKTLRNRLIMALYFTIVLLPGAIRGIFFKQISGRGCPTLHGHDAVIYGTVLLICLLLILISLLVKRPS